MSDDITAAIETSIADISDESSAAPETSADAGGASADAAPTQTTPDAAAASGLAPQAQPSPAVKVRRGPIPHDRHEAALANARAEGEAAIKAARAEYEQQVQQMRQRAELLDVADREPERFLAALAQADPRYAQLLTRAQAQQQAANGNGHDADPMPEPDGHFPDGSVGYTPAGLDRYMAWRERQIEQRITDRFKPIQEAYDAQEQTRAALSRVQVQVQEAMTWDGFAEHQPEIAKVLAADRRLSLEGAYRRVVLPKLKGDRDKMRAELVAELNAKPKHVSGTTPSGGHVPAASSDDLDSVIKAAIAAHPDR